MVSTRWGRSLSPSVNSGDRIKFRQIPPSRLLKKSVHLGRRVTKESNALDWRPFVTDRGKFMNHCCA